MYLYLLVVKDHNQKPCKPVFLYYYYYNTVTKWNYLKSKLEQKQSDWASKITDFLNLQLCKLTTTRQYETTLIDV